VVRVFFSYLCVSVCVICFVCGGFTSGAWAQAPGHRARAAAQPVRLEPESFQGSGTVAPTPAPSSSVTVPRLIKFSGILKDRKGEAKSGAAGVTFAIYAEQEGGAALWMETQNVTLDEGGHYTALLGANSSEGVPVELFAGDWERKADPSPRSQDASRVRDDRAPFEAQGKERWLGIEGADIQRTARVLLVSVPYALKAADAETLGGMPASAFVLASPQTGGAAAGGSTSGASQSGTGVATATGPGSSPATTLNATLNTVKPKAATTAATTATPDPDDFVPKFSSTSTTNLVPSAIFEMNGSVGIGTTNPTAALHVVGDTMKITSGTTAQLQVLGAASYGRFGQDGNGTFMASDSRGSSLRFLTSNGNLKEWMRIGSAGSVNIGTVQAAQFGEAVFAPDNVDSVHSVIGQAGSQYHFRLSRAVPDQAGFRDFLITPYKYGMAIEYPGTVEVWSGNFSVHNNYLCVPINCGIGANLWVGDEIDSGGLWVNAVDGGGGNASFVRLAADRFDHTSHGSLNFIVRNATDAFRFDVGPSGSEVLSAQISGTASGSYMDLFNGPVQATLRAQNGSTVDAEIGSTSNHPLSLFANNGAARATLFPSGNFSIGNNTDTAALAVGTTAQFQVSAAGAVKIGGGTPITQHVSTTASLAFAGFAANSCNTLSVPVNGAADGNSVALGIPNAVGSLDGVTWFGWVSGPGMVSIRGCNATVSNVPAPPAANIRVDVWQH
jgi:hypothetical protein